MSTNTARPKLPQFDLFSFIAATFNREENVLVVTNEQAVGSGPVPRDAEFPDEFASRVSRMHATGVETEMIGAYETNDILDQPTAPPSRRSDKFRPK